MKKDKKFWQAFVDRFGNCAAEMDMKTEYTIDKNGVTITTKSEDVTCLVTIKVTFFGMYKGRDLFHVVESKGEFDTIVSTPHAAFGLTYV
jgi:hypothetical protein